MGRCGIKFAVCLVIAMFVACSVDEPIKKRYTENVIYEGLIPVDTSVLNMRGEVDYKHGKVWICSLDIPNVLVSSSVVNANYYPWRLPTRKEASILKDIDVGTGDSRYLCVDSDIGVYYSFKFGSGSVTKAGCKTRYHIRPIRVEYTSDSIVIIL